MYKIDGKHTLVCHKNWGSTSIRISHVHTFPGLPFRRFIHFQFSNFCRLSISPICHFVVLPFCHCAMALHSSLSSSPLLLHQLALDSPDKPQSNKPRSPQRSALNIEPKPLPNNNPSRRHFTTNYASGSHYCTARKEPNELSV